MELLYTINFSCMKCANSWEVNCGPLSETIRICLGNPYLANRWRRMDIVFDVVVWAISKNSGHFEWASIARKNILFRNGPAKSMCTCCQGFAGQVQGCKGANGGACFTDWHCWQDLAICSISWSMPGHHTWLLTSDFI